MTSLTTLGKPKTSLRDAALTKCKTDKPGQSLHKDWNGAGVAGFKSKWTLSLE